MSAGYEKAIRASEGVPHAQVCSDPLHVIKIGGDPVDKVRRDEYNRRGRSSTTEGKWIKGARYSLLKDTANQTSRQLLELAEVVMTNKTMYRAFLLYGELRYIYKLPKEEAPERLDAWLAASMEPGNRQALPIQAKQLSNVAVARLLESFRTGSADGATASLLHS
jgi:transposase